MRISVLASSSFGNCSVISTGNTHVLVDAGISALRIRRGVEDCDLCLDALSGILITHEHGDHIRGLKNLGKKHKLHLFCSYHLSEKLHQLVPHADYTYLEPRSAVSIGDLHVSAFSTSHDTLDPLGFLFEHGGKRLGYITDTGCILPAMPQLLADVDALYLESNYDPNMLANSGRSQALQSRISGTSGHLSNEQAASFVRQIAHPGLSHLILGHLSPDCNTPELAARHMHEALDSVESAATIICAHVNERLPWIEV